MRLKTENNFTRYNNNELSYDECSPNCMLTLNPNGIFVCFYIFILLRYNYSL